MKLSFIVLTWNSVDHINNCINSIFNHVDEDELSYEIIVVDNGSTDGTVEVLEKLSEKYSDLFNTIYMDVNTGTTHSRNLAIKKSKGEYIAIIDSDIVFLNNALSPLVKFLQSHKNVGLVSPGLVYKDGRYQKSTDRFPTLLSKLNRYFFLKKIEKFEQRNLRSLEPCFVDYAISAFWLLPARVIQQVGLLDERIFYAPEDVDYCLRIWKEGFAVAHCPALTAIHDAREISRGFRVNQAFFSHLKGLLYYLMKHRCLFSRPEYGAKYWSHRTLQGV